MTSSNIQLVITITDLPPPEFKKIWINRNVDSLSLSLSSIGQKSKRPRRYNRVHAVGRARSGSCTRVADRGCNCVIRRFVGVATRVPHVCQPAVV